VLSVISARHILPLANCLTTEQQSKGVSQSLLFILFVLLWFISAVSTTYRGSLIYQSINPPIR